MGIHILTSHQRAVDQDKCFGLVGGRGSKLSLMLCGTLIRFPQSPPGCRGDQTDLHLPEQTVRGGQGGARGGGGELKATELTFFFLMTPSSTSAEDLNQNVNAGASEGAGLWDMLVLII